MGQDVAVKRTEPADITAAVVASFEGCRDPRVRELAQSLVRHLHAFATEVRLTEEEWAAGIRILTETGDITDERRQEFILWSDSLGLSMLVDALANAKPEGATESTVLGPFYVPGSPEREYGDSIMEQEGGVPAWIHGRVLDVDGSPIAGAELDVWEGGDNELHGGGGKPAPRSPKLQFDVKDVAATREALIARGAKMGKVSSTDGLDLCGGKDPDGNPFGLSNRSRA